MSGTFSLEEMVGNGVREMVSGEMVSEGKWCQVPFSGKWKEMVSGTFSCFRSTTPSKSPLQLESFDHTFHPTHRTKWFAFVNRETYLL